MTTAGDIAVINLESARQRSWSRFWQSPAQPGVAELIVEQELLIAQFLGDLAAFERIELLADEFMLAETEGGRAELVAAQVFCATHRFAEARLALAKAVACAGPSEDTSRLALTLDQATGANLPEVLADRRARSEQPGRWSELVPLGALLADLGEFGEAERMYRRALGEYPDLSPFAPAWVCFQLGMLWGECVPERQAERAAQWYRAALDYVPCYVKARVHLAEICLDRGETGEARALLTPALASTDPEVSWRLAEVAEASGDKVEAASHMQAARSGFDALLARHPLAFADHGAAFFAGGGGNPARAFELARLNFANRPTQRAFEQQEGHAYAGT